MEILKIYYTHYIPTHRGFLQKIVLENFYSATYYDNFFIDFMELIKFLIATSMHFPI